MDPIARGQVKRLEALVALALAGRGAGPPIPPGSEIVAEFAFTFTTSSPHNLGAIANGSTFNRAVVLVTTAFDDPSATLTLGPSGSPSALLAATDSKLSQLGQYESGALVVSAADFLQLTLNPGASTQGAGLIFWKVLP